MSNFKYLNKNSFDGHSLQGIYIGTLWTGCIRNILYPYWRVDYYLYFQLLQTYFDLIERYFTLHKHEILRFFCKNLALIPRASFYEKELCFFPFCPGILCFIIIATITLIFRLYIQLQYTQGNKLKQVTHMYMKNIIILINTVVNMAVRNGQRGKINKIKMLSQ
jgi:hypothetical protein